MPGFSSECVSGAHVACTTPDCRCQCHPATQALMRQPKKRGDSRGGVRRNLKRQVSEAVANLPAIDVQPETELRNTCPECGYKAIPTDTYCRRDGAKLLQGKQCLRCQTPGNHEDNNCHNCGLKYGENPPPEPEVPETPQEDPLIRLRRQAVEQGLLKETMVP